MTDAPSRYPLAWPAHKPRTPWNQRKIGQFVADAKLITRAAAIKRVESELTRLGGVYGILSSDLVLRQDGQPHLGKGEPYDPGACLYFQMNSKPYAMACDTYTTLAQNIAAIANHIAATRAIERYGVATAAETLQAFQALPAPGGRHWTAVLGLERGATADQIKSAHRRLMLDHHPDRGGSDRKMGEINRARDEALGTAGA